MGSSAKKKREKKQDFQKSKLKVGKARPKNTNATDTSFAAKSIVLKQQSLSETGRDASAQFNHNLSLLGSRNDVQRRDALAYLTTIVVASPGTVPQPISVILNKSQPLILDASLSVRQQFLKLLKILPQSEMGSLDQLMLYTRAGLTHLSKDIRSTTLDIFDHLIEVHGETMLSSAGGWVKTLQTFQNALSWRTAPATQTGTDDKWSAGTPATNLGSNKLLVHQLTSLARLLTAGLMPPTLDPQAVSQRAAALFPLWQTDAHLLPAKSRPFGHLNLFGASRDVESEIYDDVEDRLRIFVELGLADAFSAGVKEAKREGGEVGRAAALVDKALKLVD